MVQLLNKNILLIVTGGIAAYKTPEFVRRVKEQGAQVKVVMTSGAKAFITPLTLQAVSGEPVAEDLLDTNAEAAMGHIEFAKWADLIVVAPASADVIAKMAAGLAGDLASTLLLATPAPVAICPAMNQQMYAHAATQSNLALLANRGVHIWGPASGEQACGDIGHGRMIEPMQIVEHVVNFLTPAEQILKGKAVVITAGPTREAIDPVRYISNHSSGKMGFAIAEAAAKLGADVTLVAGPVNLATPNGVMRHDVESAVDMHAMVMSLAEHTDIFVACAAVADYRVAEQSDHKLKKSGDDSLTISLIQNPDIVASVAQLESNRPFVVGFAAETQNIEQYAIDKMNRKKLDMICANDVSISGQGFNSDQNALKVFYAGGSKDLPLNTKSELGDELMQIISTLLPSN